LGNNQFSGSIPSQLTALSNLDYLDLSNNTFSGALPSTMYSLSLLQYFSIAYNPGINGQIPEFSTGSLSYWNMNGTNPDPFTRIPLFFKNYIQVGILPRIGNWLCPIPACSTGVNCILPAMQLQCQCFCDATGGSCVEGTSDCSCVNWRYGTTCQINCPGTQNVNPAQNQWIVCNGHGGCDNGVNGTGRCTCANAYRGSDCSIACPGGANNTCNGLGVCQNDGTCTCQGNYASPDCSKCVNGWGGTGCVIQCPIANDTNDTPQPCAAQGVCQQDGTCLCYDEYQGTDCTQEKSQATAIWTAVAVVFIILALLTVGGLIFAFWCYRRSKVEYNTLEEQLKYLKEEGTRNRPGGADQQEIAQEEADDGSRLPKREKQSIDMSLMAN